jgi:hypothetical protein
MGFMQGVGGLLQDMDKRMQPKPGAVRKFYYLLDSGFSYFWLGATHRDYLDFEFYHRPYGERKTFLVSRPYNQMIKVYNRDEDGCIFKDKSIFIQAFAPYLGRQCLNLQTASLEEFLAFAAGKEKVFVKPRTGEKGHGLSLVALPRPESAEAFYQKNQGQSLIVEEQVDQHPDLAQFNPSSLNTLRLYTLIEGDEVKILSACLKLGRSQDSIADNISADGILAALDPVTGITILPGIDRFHQRFEYHPLTHHKISGFQIPNWQSVLDFVREIALIVPTVRYVGWDIGIDKEGHPLVIEGNHNAGRRALQFADQKGRLSMFKEIQRS